MTSVKISVTAFAVSASSVLFSAIMPPKAEVEIAGERPAIGGGKVGALGHAAGVGVFDDDAGRGALGVELGDAFKAASVSLMLL